ncbi:ATP-binding cassette subfamily C member 4-like [Zophobas morio]|uniref:ATP-binding cassette subfamily C member 4-like n=1 Tax=Zophobas morio TaxID=2755281 RepID=UPI003082F5F6
MDYCKPNKKSANPEKNGNCFLNLFFLYTKDVFINGYKTELTQNDIYEVLPEHKSKTLGDKLEKEWKRQLLKVNPSLVVSGNVINLITRDVNEFEEAIYRITNTIRDLCVLVTVCLLLYSENGWLFLILIAIIFVIMLINTCLAISVNKLKLKSLTKTDERYQLIKEALGAIKVIKMNLWEKSYEKKIAKIRNEEVHLIRNVNILLFLKLVHSESIHNASWYILVAVSIWFRIQSNAGTLFLIMNSLNAISGALNRNFPAALHEVATLIAVFKRIGQTLRINSEESLNFEDNNCARKIKLNLKIYTANNDTLLTLRNCNIARGITTIRGPVASGKSLLLKVIIKEYRNIEGDLEVVGSISYASQEPWLFPSTIKQNILFGSSYNENRYLEVLRVCALLEELRFLSDGDSAFVTNGGANLSKGQQARINLARAVYKERDIYLLDDCLSSLDAIVADFVFEQCIKTFLKDKIVILVTPSIKYANRSDNVITTKNGKMQNSHPIQCDIPKSVEIKRMKYIEADITRSQKEESTEEENFNHETPLLKKSKETRELYTETKVQGKVQFDTYKNYIEVNGVFAQMFYLKTGNALKRLEFLTRSPLIGYINATLDGLTTIRTSRMQDTLRKEFDQHQDLYASCSYLYRCCEKAFHFVVATDEIFLLIFAIILFLALNDKTAAAKIGLVLSQIYKLTNTQHLLYRMVTRLENQMITVERVLEYTKQKQENKDGLVVEHWPRESEIRFKDVYLSYKSDQNYILKHLNFTIKNKEKMVIVGRTGSGKTSLISTLVRLYDFEGNIFIDNVDIKALPIDFLRSKISVIPQEPTIFSGTVRENIDPTRQYSDDDIWKVIRTVNLSKFHNLDEKIDRDLSVGQKQLICLCRALIRRNKIVIFDEIKASADLETEALIQKIVSENFADYTVIAIIHKLQYILNFDLVLVVDKGVIIESGDPSSLLKRKNGMLRNLFSRQ